MFKPRSIKTMLQTSLIKTYKINVKFFFFKELILNEKKLFPFMIIIKLLQFKFLLETLFL